MPVPPHVARRCLARFCTPAKVRRRCKSSDTAAPAGAAHPRRVIADDDASCAANGGRRRACRALPPSFPPTSTRPGSQSHRVIPPPVPELPVPHDVAIEARRCLARFRWPAEFKRISPRPDAPRPGATTEPAARGGQPSVVDTAFSGGAARRVIADDDASDNGGRRTRSVLAPPFPSKSFPPCNVGVSSSEESDEEIREAPQGLFSVQSERAVYQEYLQSIDREHKEEDLPEGLFKHQRMALDWMLFRENSSHSAGGILADEQGLGKTIVVIALILKDIDQQSKFMSANSDRAAVVVGNMDEPVKKQGATTSLSELFRQPAARRTVIVKYVEDRNSSSPSTLSYRAKPAGGALVVCPSCILTQWDEEIRKFAKGFGLSVFVYHGHSRNVDPEELAKHDVVLTSYGMVKKQFPSRKRGIVKKKSDTDDLKSGPIALVKWYRIVLDEAHVIRNRTSQVAGACWKLEAEKRWCITGTPMQNGIDDLYSYLRFLRYKPYTRYSSFRSLLKEHNSTDASVGRNKLQIFLGIILLRRTKETLIDGEPIIKLPPKTIETREIVFTPVEHAFYWKLAERCKQMWIAYDATPKLRRKFEGMNSIEILSLLKDLQQACNHPCLAKNCDDQQYCTIFERSYVSSKIKATIDILNSVINQDAIIENDSTTKSCSSESAPVKALVFSQFTRMLDLLEPLLNTSHMQFRRLDGKMTPKGRHKAVNDFNMNPKVRVLLVSLMAGNVGLNLTAASHVIIVDPWWNPFVEDQAIGRAHRIGQTRPVTVHRLVVEDTIEKRVLHLQDKKRRMEELVFGGNVFTEHATNKLTEEELRYLFNE